MAIVVPMSQMALMRQRKHLKQLMKEQKWNEISVIEGQLFRDINVAVNDPHRSPKELLQELGSVIRVYKELSLLCRLHGKQVVQ